MAMLSSCTTLLSRAPAPAPGKSSPAAVLQLRSRQPAAASVAALRKVSRRSRAADVFACHALEKYNIDRDGLLLRQQPPKLADDNWAIVPDKDLFILKFKVGEGASKATLKVEARKTKEDSARLVIKYTGDPKDDTTLADLTMPPGYDDPHKVHAKIFNAWLIIAIAKTAHDSNKVFFNDKLGQFYYDPDKVEVAIE